MADPQGRVLSEEEFNAIKAQVLKDMPAHFTEEEFNRQIGPRMAQALGTAEYLPRSWQTQYPGLTTAAKIGVETLPGAGAVLGAAVGGVPGFALGAGVGKGARDLAAMGLGLDEPTSPLEKGQAIANEISISTLLGAGTAKTAALIGRARRAIRTLTTALSNPDVSPSMREIALDALSTVSPRAGAATRTAVATKQAVTKLSQAAAQIEAAQRATPPPRVRVRAVGPPAPPAAAPPDLSGTNLQVSGEEALEAERWLRQGVSPDQIVKRILATRQLQGTLGSRALSPEQARAAVTARNLTGRWPD